MSTELAMVIAELENQKVKLLKKRKESIQKLLSLEDKGKDVG